MRIWKFYNTFSWSSKTKKSEMLSVEGPSSNSGHVGLGDPWELWLAEQVTLTEALFPLTLIFPASQDKVITKTQT